MSQRLIRYREAIAEATVQSMDRDESIFVMGESADDPLGIFGTTRLAFEKFGGHRVFDVPLSENALTGWGTGAAISGMKPLMVHQRNDFLLLALDQVINHAAKWKYIHGRSVPWTIRAIIGKRWGQAAQHSQALQALFAHVPGLKVVLPASPYDAKGLLAASLFDDSPVICLEHRGLYETMGVVPEEYYEVPLGVAKLVRTGKDVTVVAISEMVSQAQIAAEKLSDMGVDAEIIDLRCVRPLDLDVLVTSVKKTGHLISCDVGWTQFGISAEVVCCVAERAHEFLKKAPVRIGLPDCPTPCSYALEEVYYPDNQDIVAAAAKLFSLAVKDKCDRSQQEKSGVADFVGPF